MMMCYEVYIFTFIVYITLSLIDEGDEGIAPLYCLPLTALIAVAQGVVPLGDDTPVILSALVGYLAALGWVEWVKPSQSTKIAMLMTLASIYFFIETCLI